MRRLFLFDLSGGQLAVNLLAYDRLTVTSCCLSSLEAIVGSTWCHMGGGEKAVAAKKREVICCYRIEGSYFAPDASGWAEPTWRPCHAQRLAVSIFTLARARTWRIQSLNT
jgi:hypothetical protein